jgi:hypothetical protein
MAGSQTNVVFYSDSNDKKKPRYIFAGNVIDGGESKEINYDTEKTFGGKIDSDGKFTRGKLTASDDNLILTMDDGTESHSFINYKNIVAESTGGRKSRRRRRNHRKSRKQGGNLHSK